jgi:hypothetical protein
MAELHLRTLFGTLAALVVHGSHLQKMASEVGDGRQVRRKRDAAALKRAEVTGQRGIG